jgi:hypothetical protein
VHRESKNCVVTFWVMSQFLHFLGASRGCADFRDPTAVFRLIVLSRKGNNDDLNAGSPPNLGRARQVEWVQLHRWGKFCPFGGL